MNTQPTLLAYIDSGAGSMMLQALLAAVFTASFAMRGALGKVKAFIYTRSKAAGSSNDVR